GRRGARGARGRERGRRRPLRRAGHDRRGPGGAGPGRSRARRRPGLDPVAARGRRRAVAVAVASQPRPGGGARTHRAGAAARRGARHRLPAAGAGRRRRLGGLDRRGRRHAQPQGRAHRARPVSAAPAAAAPPDPPGAPDAIAVLYRDPHLAVVDKPAGLMAHASALARGERDFLADRLREQFGGPVYMVHRLDRATSGCLLLAFDRDTAAALGRALMAGEVDKQYLAVCRGWPGLAFTIDHPLDGGPGKPLKKPALTRFERLATCELDLPSAGFP